MEIQLGLIHIARIVVQHLLHIMEVLQHESKCANKPRSFHHPSSLLHQNLILSSLSSGELLHDDRVWLFIQVTSLINLYLQAGKNCSRKNITTGKSYSRKKYGWNLVSQFVSQKKFESGICKTWKYFPNLYISQKGFSSQEWGSSTFLFSNLFWFISLVFFYSIHKHKLLFDVKQEYTIHVWDNDMWHQRHTHAWCQWVKPLNMNI